jgi:hypothetical protein
MGIRVATEADWPAIWPFWRDIVEAGETYAYPLGATSDQARGWWFDGIQFNAVVETHTGAVRLWQDLGFTIVGTVPGAFDSTRHGRVALHVMYLDLG